MGIYPVAVYYSKTQHTNNTPHSNKHSTQNYINNERHTTHNDMREREREITNRKCMTSIVEISKNDENH
jgi:hypothetical protein